MKERKIFSKLERKRKNENISQGEMARLLGYSRITYNHWKTGKTVPGKEALKRMFMHLKNTREIIVHYCPSSDPEYFRSWTELLKSLPRSELKRALEEKKRNRNPRI